MIPICSFVLVAKITKKEVVVRKIESLSDHLRNKRLAMGIDQTQLAKLFNISNPIISNWEANKKQPSSYYFDSIVSFLGYIPQITMGFDRYGIYTQLYRKEHKLSQKMFAKIVKIHLEEIVHLEENKYGKRKRKLEPILKNFFKHHPISSLVLS